MLTTKQAAEKLGVSPRTLEAWRRLPTAQQPLPYRTDGYRCWYAEDDVTFLIESETSRIRRAGSYGVDSVHGPAS